MSAAPVTTRPIDAVLARLDAPRVSGPDSWSAKCPAHPDRSPSLSVSIGEGERVLLHCHAGCDVADVVQALNLSAGDLFVPRADRATEREQIYSYRDEHDVELFQVVRKPGKKFLQRHNEGGAWTWNTRGVRRVPYRLPEVIAAVAAGQPVWIVEGEKDVLTLAEYGIVATCNPGGAGKWGKLDPACLDVFRGAAVVIVPDQDEPGERHAEQVYRALVDVAASITFRRPANGKDATDHLVTHGLTLDQFAPIDGTVGALVVDDGQASDGHVADGKAGGTWAERLAPSLIAFDTDFWNADHGTDWLIEPVVPRARQVAINAKAKAGKSLLTLDLSAAVATGRAVLDRPTGEPLSVVYLDYEMTADDLRERLADMGYSATDDLSNLHYYLLPSMPPLDTAEGGKALAEIAERHAADLVVIDTTSRVIAGEENSADTFADFYRHTGLRLKAAGVAMLRLDHTGHNDPDRARGSSAKAADVDLVWSLTATDTGLKLKRTHQRINWAPEVVDLRRRENPLRHELAAGSWPAGTRDLAKLLDTLGIPIDTSVRKAREALKHRGHGARNDVVSAAIRYRRNTPDAVLGRTGNTPGNTSSGSGGNASGNSSPEPRNTGAVTPPVTPGNTDAAHPVTVPPLLGGTVPEPDLSWI